MIHSYSIHVTSKDIDDLGHVNNLTYIHWIIDAAKSHWISQTDKYLQTQYAWVVLSHFIEYKNPAFLSDELSIETWVDSFSSNQCERHTLVKNTVTGKIIVSAITKWCPISFKTQKPTRIIPKLVDPFLK